MGDRITSTFVLCVVMLELQMSDMELNILDQNVYNSHVPISRQMVQTEKRCTDVSISLVYHCIHIPDTF